MKSYIFFYFLKFNLYILDSHRQSIIRHSSVSADFDYFVFFLWHFSLPHIFFTATAVFSPIFTSYPESSFFCVFSLLLFVIFNYGNFAARQICINIEWLHWELAL